MHKKLLGLVLALLMIFTVNCGLAETAAITTTDMMGQVVTLDAPATRIVALTAADCEILYALGAGDTLVGRGAYCDYPAVVLEVPSVESGYETNLEQIIALNPDLVLMNTMAQTIEQVEMLRAAGIAVATSEATDITGVYTSITLIGALTGKNAEAAALVADMQAIFVSLNETPLSGSVYFEVSPLEYGLWTAAQGTFLQEIADILGLTNIFSDLEGWAQISEEQVIARNPDYIVTLTPDYETGVTPTEEILNRLGWESITAIQNAAVYFAGNPLTRPGPRLAEGALALRDALTTP
ncbi:MAG TPA: ABC transporter substrate-binding protein [Candidatus Limiplasma sp.]|nr:ABC transporter substrate-binding protein [Candidatus Limiplasma sp.]HRX08458.1 ABC transporter substrate-binding protein [Candidatus Limiplasma sp.]